MIDLVHAIKLNWDWVKGPTGTPEWLKFRTRCQWWIAQFSSQNHLLVSTEALLTLELPPVEVISVGQIFLPSGSLPAVRGVAPGLICLLLCSQIEYVHRGSVNGQKCGSAGTWRAGLPKRNFFQRLPDRTPCLSLLLCLVLCYLAQDGNSDVCVLFTSCTCECSPWRQLQNFANVHRFSSGWRQLPKSVPSCLFRYRLYTYTRRTWAALPCSAFATIYISFLITVWPKILENTKEMAKSMVWVMQKSYRHKHKHYLLETF